MRLLSRILRNGDEDRLPDEAILNVLRRSNEPLLRTAEIAEDLPITQDWTNKRLKELESKGRVYSKSAGQGRVWSLDDSEPTFPVREGIGDLMWYTAQMKQSSTITIWSGLGLFGVAGLIALILFISYLRPDFFFQFYTSDDVVTAMWLAGIGGALFILAGGLLRLVSIGIPRLLAD